MELGIRTYLQKEQNDEHRTSLLRSDLLYYYMKDMLVLETEEQVWAVMLDVKGNFIARHLVARGGFTSADVDIRVILQKSTPAKVLPPLHSYTTTPSGDATPSTQDDDLTARLKEACALDILLVDHIIYVDNKTTITATTITTEYYEPQALAPVTCPYCGKKTEVEVPPREAEKPLRSACSPPATTP